MKRSVKLIVFTLIAAFLTSQAVSAYDLVVAGEDYPVDFFLAQTYTSKEGIPLIGVSKKGFTQPIVSELSAYVQQGYSEAVIIGGTEAVPASVERSLRAMNYSVVRIWDWNRYGTAARVAITLWEESETVVIAEGDREGAIMPAARIAIDYGSPVLLTERGKLSESAEQAIEKLGARRIVIVGDVSEEARKKLDSLGGVEQTKLTQLPLVETGGRSSFVVGLIAGGLIIFLITSLWGAEVIRRKQSEIPYDILQEDERRIVELIDKQGGKMKQQNLDEMTGFSRPKVSRLVAELVERGILSKRKSGKTNILELIKEMN
jgi:uncharacterized membrane protein